MKLRIIGIFSLLIGFSFLVINCSSKSTPATPEAPAPTNTVCADATGHTCTSTDTATPTDTATVTPTSTSTSSPTPTDSKTPSATTTNTGTSTSTGTPSNTRTDTATATITNTPTNTGTPTQTGTPTATNQFTSTQTATNSPTSTVTQTSTPTPDCTGTNSISGTISYTGPTSGGSGLYAIAGTDLSGGNSGSCSTQEQALSGTSASYSFTFLPAGSYYVVGLYGPPPTGNGPPLGTYVLAYNAASPGSPTCIITTTDRVNSATNPSGINFTFSNAYTLNGVNALVTYTGSQTGKSLNIGLFNSGYTTEVTGNGGFNSGSVATLIDQTNTCSTGATAYVMAWYGNSNSGPQSGDPYGQTSTTEINTSSTNATISFGDGSLWP